ncbi:Putative pentatricopeptide repeat-containing protein At1g03510 [Dionaea muscipula]
MASCNSNYIRLLSYTRQLTAHVNQGRHEKALILFHQMHSSISLSLDSFVFPLTLKSCAALHQPVLGTSLHAHVTKSSFVSNPYVACALVDFYGKCVTIFSARKVFDETPQRTVVVWNAMISLYAHSSDVPMVLRLFESMDVPPNASTFNSIIACLLGTDDGYSKAVRLYRQMQSFGLRANLITVLALLPVCAGLAAFDWIKEVHGYSVRNEIDPHPQLSSCLVEAYGRCGSLDHALSVFKSMEDKEKDLVAWSSLISAYALNGEAVKALEMFHQMELANIRPDAITFFSVMKACSHAGLPDEAKQYFARMSGYYGVQATSDHYSCLVDVLSRSGRLQEAYDVLKGMPMKATAKAWGALFGACSSYGEVELAEIAARALLEIEPDNAANYVLLARIYAGLGRHEEADRVRRQMKGTSVKTAPGSSWFG